MRILSFIEDREVIQAILKHPWAEGREKEDQKRIVKYYECF
jgi:hypothetical protein